MAVRVKPVDVIRQIFQRQVCLRIQRRTLERIGLPLCGSNGACRGRQFRVVCQFHVVAQHQRAAALLIDCRNRSVPGAVIFSIDGKCVFLHRFDEIDILAHNRRPGLSQLCYRTDIHRAARFVFNAYGKRLPIGDPVFCRIRKRASGKCVAVVYRIVNFCALGRAAKRNDGLLVVCIGSFVRADCQRRFGWPHSALQRCLHRGKNLRSSRPTVFCAYAVRGLRQINPAEQVGQERRVRCRMGFIQNNLRDISGAAETRIVHRHGHG